MTAPWYRRGARLRRRGCLLDRDGGAGGLEGLLGLVRGLLVGPFDDRLWGALDELLGLLQTQAGEAADLLDDLDLLVADRVEDDVELDLLLGSGFTGAVAGGRGGGNRDRRGSSDAEGVLELLHELAQLEEGHLLERVEQVFGADLRHWGFTSLVSLSACGFGGLRVGCGRVFLELGLQGAEDAGHVGQRCVEQRGGVLQGRLHGAGQLAEQHVAGLEVGELADLVSTDRAAFEVAALDDQGLVGPAEVAQALRGLDDVALDEGDRRRTDQEVGEAVDAGVLGSELGQGVLDDRVGRVLAQGASQLLEVVDAQAAIVGQDSAAGVAELVSELRYRRFLVSTRHGSPSARASHGRARGRGLESPSNEATPAQERTGRATSWMWSDRVTCAGCPRCGTFGLVVGARSDHQRSSAPQC